MGTATATRPALPALFFPTLTMLARPGLTRVGRPGLTKRRAVDFCRVATALCRPVPGRREPAASPSSGTASC
jgi:hypothetical protein